MHTYKQQLLFEKEKTNEHWLATKFLTTKPALLKLGKHLELEYSHISCKDSDVNRDESCRILDVEASTEHPLYSFEYRRKRTFRGFLDVKATFLMSMPKTQRMISIKGGTWVQRKDFDGRFKISVAIEVKFQPEDLGSILRQMQYYQHLIKEDPSENGRFHEWVLATGYKFSELDIQILKNAGFQHIYLGDDFQRFCELEQSQPGTVGMEL